MTDPTDADLLAEWDRVSHIADAGQRRLACLRAVLAKWGTLRAKKIVIPTDTMEQEFQKHYRRGYEAGKKVTTPQPTQAQADTPCRKNPFYHGPRNCIRGTVGCCEDHGAKPQAQAGAVPLTKEQAASLCKMGPVYAPDGRVVRPPEQYRRELEGAKLAGIRTAERAHGIGIKGGQHVTDI